MFASPTEKAAQAAFSVFNHLVRDEPWAREALQPFAGQTVLLASPPGPTLAARIASDGTLVPDPSAHEAALRITIPPRAWLALAVDRERAIAQMTFAGDAALAGAFQLVARALRWDAEDDLARVVGDIAARRLTRAGRAASAWPRAAGERLSQHLGEYLAEEKRALVARHELTRLGREIAALEARLADLGHRIGNLEQRVR